jgi:hypothetical protein
MHVELWISKGAACPNNDRKAVVVIVPSYMDSGVFPISAET